MATLYFNGAVDDNWQTLGNWWTSYDPETDTYSSPAAGLPTSADDVALRSSCGTNSGSAPTVLTLIADNAETLGISMTATGGFTFNNSAQSTGTLTGDCVFDNSSYNGGTIQGDCTFNNGANSAGSITGNCTFGGGSYNTGTITGNCTFDGGSYNTGTITGNCTFSNGSYNEYGGSAYTGEITGNCEFSSGSENRYVVFGNCTFYGDSSNTGFVFGGAVFYGTSYSQGGYTTGSLTMYDYSSYTGAGYNVGEPSAATFNDFSSLLGEDVWAFNSGEMNDRSYAGGAEVGGITFNDNSYGVIRASSIAFSGNPIVPQSMFVENSQITNNPVIEISFVRRSGINGSSILGII